MRQICPQIEPFEHASTIAKLALEIWRAQFLEPNIVLNFPEEGLNKRQQQSEAALKFLKIYSLLTNKRVQCAEWSIGEHKVEGTGYRVDGLIRDGNKKVAIEFLGCRYHGEKGIKNF